MDELYEAVFELLQFELQREHNETDAAFLTSMCDKIAARRMEMLRAKEAWYASQEAQP